MSRSKLGPIPDDHFENDALPYSADEKPLSAEMQAWLEQMKKGLETKKDGE